jgi:hypothetical protein
MLSFIVALFMIGILAGAVARDLAPDPHPLGDAGPWIAGIVLVGLGGIIGLILGGGDPDRNADQAAALVGFALGGVLAIVGFVAAASTRNRSTAQEGTTHGS